MELPYSIEKEDDIFVSCCPILDVVSQGYTEKEAMDNLTEAVFLFITTCFEMGTLDEGLKQCGFSAAKKATKQPAKTFPTFNVDIPYSVANNKIECPA